MITAELFERAFPAALRAEVTEAVGVLPPAEFAPLGLFGARVDGEPVSIPYRIYHPEPAATAIERLPTRHRTILSCLYTRHHDGRVRQRHLRMVMGEAHPWVAPFVVRLVGEYVVEIVLDIRERLAGVEDPASPLHVVYGRFAAENAEFLDLTRSRAASYWDCYYRLFFPHLVDYPATEVLRSLRDAGRAVGQA